jgi:outer membrane receptor protein involved in Fe transport
MASRFRVVVFLVIALLGGSLATAQPERPLQGRPVQSVIDELRAAGAPLVYSSNLLPSSLTIDVEPGATAPLELAREILRPHGLAVREQDGVWLVVRGEPPARDEPGAVRLSVRAAYGGAPLPRLSAQLDPPNGPAAEGIDGRVDFAGLRAGNHSVLVRADGFVSDRFTVDVEAGRVADLSVVLFETTPPLEELIVTASRYEVGSRAEPSATYFSRDQIESLASLGDDTIRVTHHLPGVATNEFSARPYVRGGAPNELAVLVDGVRIVEPYHLRDFQGVFSVVDQRVVDSVAVHAGGFPAAYGDALSALLVIEPREPTQLAHEIGLSALYTSLLSSGTFADGRGSWLASARNSNLERVLADELGQPAFSDSFVRVGTDLGSKQRLTFGSLRFRDDIVLTLEDAPGDRQVATSDTSSRQLWLKLDSAWTDSVSSTTWLYSTAFESSRREDVADLDEIIGSVDDQRTLDAVGIKQAWRLESSARQLLSFGAEVEQRDASYRYSSGVERRGLLATLGGTAPPMRALGLDPGGDSYGVYVEDRVRATERLIVDVGVRWDRQTYLPPAVDSQFSPRASLLYRVGSKTDLRVSHGRFFQAEGLLDLQVEDGVSAFSPPQRAAHSIVSLEHRFQGTLALRAELYRKWTRHVRPRYENLFDPIELLPELRASRVRIAPERAEAKGLDLFVSGESPVSWWAGLSLARAEDEVSGVDEPRSWDQRRALNAGVSWRAGAWDLSGAAIVHRGWPTTTVTVVTNPNGERVVVAGARNASRLGAVRRLDARASRDFGVGPGALRFFAEITNLTNRRNACCLVYEPVTTADGPSLTSTERARAGITGNVGLLWQV